MACMAKTRAWFVQRIDLQPHFTKFCPRARRAASMLSHSNTKNKEQRLLEGPKH